MAQNKVHQENNSQENNPDRVANPVRVFRGLARLLVLTGCILMPLLLNQKPGQAQELKGIWTSWAELESGKHGHL